MTYLFDTYGNISDKKMNEQHQRTVNHTYVHSDPIANASNAIKQYYEIRKSSSALVKSPSPMQIFLQTSRKMECKTINKPNMDQFQITIH